MIDFSTLKGLTIPEGNVKQIADASGRVLWSATIKFLINGDTYIADRGMTWAQWFASSYNTTGETEGTITDASGNEISMDAVIVSGAEYEVEFVEMATVSLSGTSYAYGPSSSYRSEDATATINGVTYVANDGYKHDEYVILSVTPQNYELPVGTEIVLHARTSIKLNGTSVGLFVTDYTYVVKGNVSIVLRIEYNQNGPSSYGPFGYIEITEQ